MNKLKVAFDVDGTLIFDERHRDLFDTPNYKVIALFKAFEELGCEMFIWSGGGISYSIRWADKLGLKAIHVRKGSFVPDIAVDDEETNLGKITLKV